MESLKCLSKDCIDLLQRNNLMKPLIKAELIKDKLSSIKVKKEEKAFKITPKTKIIDKDGTKVAAADAKFEMAMVKADKADAGTAAMIKEFAKKAKAPKKKKE